MDGYDFLSNLYTKLVFRDRLNYFFKKTKKEQ